MKKIRKHGAFFIILAVFATTTAGLFGSFYFFREGAPSAIAATCPFVDNDANDSDATVGTYSLNANYSVPAAATAYDCTSGSGITTFIVPNAVKLTLLGNTGTGEIARVDFTNLTVNSGGTISADFGGCAWGEPSYAPNGSNVCTSGATGSAGRNGGGGGGGHGGPGGTSGYISGLGGATYDSPTAPVLFGAGGGASGSGAYGGGVVRLNVTGTFTHNGSITADGQNASAASTYGGGAGGSIYITTATINGTTGTFSADGGNGAGGSFYGGGGGGGRIALVHQGGSFTFSSSAFTVSGGASGGGTAVAGTKGTVYVVNTQGTGPTTDDEVTIYHGFTYEDVDYSVGYWIVDASATNQYCASTAVTPSISAGAIKIGGTLTCGPDSVNSGQNATGVTSFNLSASSSFDALASTSWSLTNTNADMDWNIPAGDNQTWTNVTVTGPKEGDFTINDAVAITLSGTSAVNANVQWTALTNLTIDSTASINASSKGCATGNPGYGPNGSNVCVSGGTGSGAQNGGGGGGGHGGAGGASSGGGAGGSTYDSATAPVLFGAGGAQLNAPGGMGGGAIRLGISGTFTMNGSISANGASAGVSTGSGGGSGGSIYVTAATINGTTGIFSANGGNGAEQASNYGGGGGGGRVAITRTGGSFSFDSGDFTVSGGNGSGGSSVAGAKGTVYVKNTATSRVDIFHGFTYTDTDYVETAWVIDSSATNQYCTTSGSATPSVSAANLTFGGTLNCTTSLASFNWSASASFTVSNNASFTVSATDADIDWNIPAGDNQTWTNVTVTGPKEGDFTINDAVAITLSGTSAVNANVQWTALTDLTIGSSASINANYLGCANGNPSYAPNASNICTSGATGSGTQNGGSGGGGHGGSGGNGTGSGTGGATYDSATAPVRYGAGGAQGAASGGRGGGLIRLSMTGTFTNNGSLLAKGANATTGVNAAGGAGGSIYVQTSVYTCSSAPTVSAAGGNGANNGSTAGGGGGGGRIRIEYASDTCGAQPLSGLSAGTVAAGGASGGLTASAGSTGSLSVLNTDNPPVVSVAVASNPTTPNVNQQVTISATFTDDNGVNQIKLFLNGIADPANVVKTCTFSPAQSPATCSYNIGTQSDGPHTIRATGRDTTSQTTDSDGSFTVGSFTTAGTMTLSRLKAGATNVDFALQFTLVGPDTAPLTVTFPSGFTVTQAFTSGTCSGGGTVASFGYTALTLTATKTACIGTVTLSGAKITNHATPGAYTVTWTNDSGSGSVYIVVDDQVTVSGTVDPVLTFNAGAQAAATACDGTFSGSGGSLSLGTLTTGAVGSSDVSSVPHICTRMTTNASSGAIVTILSSFGALRSASAPADQIASSTATLSAGAAGYGICTGSGGGDTGRDATTPTGASPTATAPFNGSCSTSGHAVGALTTSAQTIWSLSSPSQNAFARLFLKAAISPVTPAHSDYADTLTFVATGTY